jgi:hypothetical protein
MMDGLNNLTNDNKVNIKLEVCRDKVTGKLSIIAHFNECSPNIFKENDDFFWMPTQEEKDLLNEAFELVKFDRPPISSDINPPKKEDIDQINIEPKVEIKIQEEKTEEFTPNETINKPSVFDTNHNNIENINIEKNKELPHEDFQTKNEEKLDFNSTDNSKEITENQSDKSDHKDCEMDKGLIVEADSDAIEAALKKYNDKSIVSVDEHTIVDKVISQKKKGKWSQY